MEQKIIDNKENKIKIIEIVSKIFLILFCLFNLYYSQYRPGWEIVCLGSQINGLILASPLIVAIILEIIAFSKLKEYNLPTKDSIKSFSKFLIFSLLFFFVSSIFFCSLCGHKGKASDARRMSELVLIRDVQKQFHDEKGRYASSLKELEDTSYFSGALNEAERFNIIFEKDMDSDAWRAYAYIREYRHEICVGIKEPKYIYVCDNKDCREETIK